jgi:hypothetical protein
MKPGNRYICTVVPNPAEQRVLRDEKGIALAPCDLFLLGRGFLFYSTKCSFLVDELSKREIKGGK